MNLLILVGALLKFSVVIANIYHEGSKIEMIPNKAANYFGFSVLFLKNSSPISLKVGAPRSANGGALFTCNLSDMESINGSNQVICTDDGYNLENTNDMWFGWALDEFVGKLFITAPRWFMAYSNTHYLLHGACYYSIIDRLFRYTLLNDRSKQAYVTDGKRKEYGEYGLHLNYYAYGQNGFSIAVTDNESDNFIILGAPGLLQWTGGVIVISLDNVPSIPNPYELNNLGPDEYFGYSVATGVFTLEGKTLCVSGAPRSKSGFGQVLIFDVIRSQHNTPVIIYAVVKGPQLGAYFGASLCVVDLDNDGRSDLLIGAPTFVNKNDELPFDQGAVFVYLSRNKNMKLLFEERGYVQGSNKNGARFGTSISSLGDTDDDGFSDVAIGAPFEDDGVGAVYIYRGNKDGLRNKYSQRIVAETAKGFGFAISKSYDFDKNGCNDLAIGAIDSATSFVYKCVPTITIDTSIKVPNAMDLPQNSTNFDVIFCVKVLEHRIWPHISIDLKATITVDREAARASISDDPQYTITAKPGQELCEEKIVNVSAQADLSKPITIFFNVERIGILDEDSLLVLPPTLARVSEDSILSSSFDIQLTRDCGEDLICLPQIEMEMTALSSPYIPGLSEKLGVKITVKNVAEPAYDIKVNVTLPLGPIRTPSLCTLHELNMTCIVPAPLHRNDFISWDIELESLETESNLVFVATLLEPFEFKKNNTSTVKELSLKVTPISNITVFGKAIMNNTILVSRKTFNEEKYVNYFHFFEITNYGPSGCSLMSALFSFSNISELQNDENMEHCLEENRTLSCKFSIAANVSIPLLLKLRYNLSLSEEPKNTGVTNATTMAVISVGNLNINASVTTTFVLEPAAPIWPIILGVFFGLVLLSAITYLLFKHGFFSRQRREDLKKLKETANHPSGSQDDGSSGCCETVNDDYDDSVEQLLEDSE